MLLKGGRSIGPKVKKDSARLPFGFHGANALAYQPRRAFLNMQTHFPGEVVVEFATEDARYPWILL
jgi:hypothetical protein